MIRLARLTDYAFVILNTMVQKDGEVLAASDLADLTKLPQPTVSKVLKSLSKAGLLVAHRGAKGGYSLSRPSSQITALDVVQAMEGKVALTDCLSGERDKPCEIEGTCANRGHWNAMNRAVSTAMGAVTLADMACPAGTFLQTQSGERLGRLESAVNRPCACHQAGASNTSLAADATASSTAEAGAIKL